MFKRKRYHYDAFQGGVGLTSVINDAGFLATTAGGIYFYYTPDQTQTAIGAYATVERYVESPGVIKRRFRSFLAGTVVHELVLADDPAIEAYLEFLDLKIYTEQSPDQWHLEASDLSFYVNGGLEHSYGALDVACGLVTPAGIPLIGIPPLVGATASCGRRLSIPPSLSEFAYDASSYATVRAGYRYKLAGEPDWTVRPVTPKEAAGSKCLGLCPGPDPGDVTADDSWNVVLKGKHVLRNTVTDQGERLTNCRPPCVTNRPLKEHWYGSTVEDRVVGQSCLIVPDEDREVVRIGEEGHAEDVLAWGFPYAELVRTDLCGDCVSTVTDKGSVETLLPSRSQILFVAGDVTHPAEDAFAKRVYAPSMPSGDVRMASGTVKVTVETLICSRPVWYFGSCTPVMAATPAKTCCRDFGVSWASQRLDGDGGNPQMNPVFTHPAPGLPDDVMSWAARLQNTWWSPHWQYQDWFPPDVEGGALQPYEWPLYGARANPTEYWLPLKTQKTSHPDLPPGENRGTRTDLISASLYQTVLDGLMLACFGQVTSWWGSSQFIALPIAPPASVQMDAASSALWSCTGGTLTTFGASTVLVTPTGSGPGQVTVEIDLGSHDTPPYWYPHFAKQVQVEYVPTNLDGATVYADGVDGSAAMVATDQLPHDFPSGGATKYAGDWAREYSPTFDPTDVGTDADASGDSAATCADSERIVSFQLLPGFGRSKLRIVFDVQDRASTFELKYPTFFAPTSRPWLIPKTGQTFVLLYDDGPALQLGETEFFDYLNDRYQTAALGAPFVHPFGYQPSIGDGLSLRNMLFMGVDREDGLDAELASLFESGTEYTLRDHFWRDPFRQIPCTHSWWAMTEDKTGLVLCLTASVGETPPVSHLAERARDNERRPTGDLGIRTYTYAKEPRSLVSPRGPLTALEVSGVDWTVQWTDVPSGFQERRHAHATDDTEGPTAEVLQDGTVLAELTPWHACFFVGVPGQAGANPWNHEDAHGRYARTDVVDGNVWFRGKDFSRPVGGFDRQVQVSSGGSDSNPRLLADPRLRRYFVVFER